MGNENSFDNLVSGISVAERQDMLDKMKVEKSNISSDTFVPIEEISKNAEIPLSEQLKKESLILRLILWIKSIFTNTKPEVLFNEIKVSNMAKNLMRDFPGLVDSKRGIVLPLFYEKFLDLKNVAEFFKPYIAAIEQDEGTFYVYLGSVVMPSVATEMMENVDPYSNPITGEAKLEYRVELLHNMDDVFQSISHADKQKMYESVKSIEWFRQFVRLPFSRFMSLFSAVTDEIRTCQFSQLESEIGAFAKCLCNTFSLPDELLEAIYLFSIRNLRSMLKNKDSVDIEEDEDVKRENEYMNKAHECISNLHLFMDSVPMHSISCVICGDSQWIPEHFVGGEDWFVKYKASWKKIFEQKWDSWVQDCKKENLRIMLNSHFGLETFPLLPNRPWLDLWGGVRFRYELTGGFLYWYFLKKFPTFELTLKSLMVEGVFKKKENQLSFTDSYNEFIQISLALTAIDSRVKPSGDVGLVFSKIQSEIKIRTLQEQTKIEQLMRSVESDMQTVLHRFGDSSRLLLAILDGVLGLRKDARFDTILNLNLIQGRNNEAFQKTLKEARQSFESALNLIKELENIDAPKNLGIDIS